MQHALNAFAIDKPLEYADMHNHEFHRISYILDDFIRG